MDGMLVIGLVSGPAVTVGTVIGIYLKLSSKIAETSREAGQTATRVETMYKDICHMVNAQDKRVTRLEQIENSKH